MRRKKSYLLIFLCLLAISCRLGKDYNPAVHLSPAEQEEIMDKVLRYMAKPPDGISTEERFYRGYDEHYAEQRRIQRLVNENKTLSTKVTTNETQKIQLEKSLEANKLEHLVLLQKIVNNKKAQDSVSATTVPIKRAIELHKERLRKVN